VKTPSAPANRAAVAVVGAGVVGCATALELARRGADVELLEAEPEPALAASGTNSGILHTGFDSKPGELETEMILRAGALREHLLDVLGVPVLRCGALMRPLSAEQREPVAALAANAAANAVSAHLNDDSELEIPGEAVTDPVAFTLALAGAAERHGARLRFGFRVAAAERRDEAITLQSTGGERSVARIVVNCAGLGGGEVARLLGDDSFAVYPRKGEFLVFDPPDGPLERILLPVPSETTKGVLVFPTVDGKLVAGPTAVDLEEPDWSARPEARDQILPKATSMYPPLEGAEPLFAYAGLRPAGRGVNYVIGRSKANAALVNVAAIRSTGLTASPAIAERAAALVAEAGADLDGPTPLRTGPAPSLTGPWWRRAATYRDPGSQGGSR
jgi:glycerol-3-phosphate dehydrogenase